MARPKPVPLDRLVVKRGLAPDLETARQAIQAGEVLVDGLPSTNPARQIRPDQPLRRAPTGPQWVGRGALKLLGALEDLPMEVAGHVAADLGSSTGGFTQVLLEQGAERVYAIDVGRGLLHRSLEVDPRVVVMDETNARTLEGLPEPVTRIVGDLSFISLTSILPTLGRLLADDGQALLLVKPQFEAERDEVQPGGVVTGEARERAIGRVLAALEEADSPLHGHADCRVHGARSGNVEHFVWIGRPRATVAGSTDAC